MASIQQGVANDNEKSLQSFSDFSSENSSATSSKRNSEKDFVADLDTIRLTILQPQVEADRRSSFHQVIDAEANIVTRALQIPLPTAPAHKKDEPVLPPDGGLQAWLQVAGSFFLFFNSWGTVNTFGVFQTYYEVNPMWSASPSDISWIGSVQVCLLLTVGVITGPLYDMGYFRHLVITGAVLIPLGFIMTSFCHTYWQTMLAQGACIGIGNGALLVPSVAILPQYFARRKALANGISTAGSSLGGVVYSIGFRQLEQRIGFAWATRILGCISLTTLLFSVCVMKPLFTPQTRRKLHDLAAFKEPPYAIFCIATLVGFIGLFGPLYYLETFAISTGITSASFGFYLIPILNAASIAGRIIPNFLADLVGPLNILCPAAVLTGSLVLAWIGLTTLSGTIVFAIVYGFSSGAFIALSPVAIVTLSPDLRKLGTRLGQSFFLCALGALVGPPVTGAILSATGSWPALKAFSGIVILINGLLLLVARVYVVGWSLKVKA